MLFLFRGQEGRKISARFNQILERSFDIDGAMFQQDDAVSIFQILELMRHENNDLVLIWSKQKYVGSRNFLKSDFQLLIIPSGVPSHTFQTSASQRECPQR